MSGSVLASIIQHCKAHNKCFTSSPQDATPVQGLHSSVQRAQTGAERRGGGGEERRSSGGENEKGFLLAYRGNIGNPGYYSS